MGMGNGTLGIIGSALEVRMVKLSWCVAAVGEWGVGGWAEASSGHALTVSLVDSSSRSVEWGACTDCEFSVVVSCVAARACKLVVDRMSVVAAVEIGGLGMHGVKIWTRWKYGGMWSCAVGKGGGKEREGCDQQTPPGQNHRGIRYTRILAG